MRYLWNATVLGVIFKIAATSFMVFPWTSKASTSFWRSVRVGRFIDSPAEEGHFETALP